MPESRRELADHSFNEDYRGPVTGVWKGADVGPRNGKVLLGVFSTKDKHKD